MNEELDEIQKLIQRHAAQISEHVGAVQIIVTTVDGDKSFRYTTGVGCWYSRIGAIREMIIREDANIVDSIKNNDNE